MQPSKVESITVIEISFVNTPDNIALPADKRLVVVGFSNGIHQVTTLAEVTQQIMAIRNRQSEFSVVLQNSRLIVSAIEGLIDPSGTLSQKTAGDVIS